MSAASMSAIQTMAARQIYNKLTADDDKKFETELLSTVRMVELTPSQRARVIAALWAARGRPALKTLFETLPAYRDQAALQRAAVLLDTPRLLRQSHRQLATASRRKRRSVQDKINELTHEDVPDAFSLTRSFAKILGRLLCQIPKDRLEFDLLFYENATKPDGPWQPLADVAHLRPDTWQLESFQQTVFGAEPPADSLLAHAKTLSSATLPAMLERHETLAKCYSFIRNKMAPRTFDRACRSALGRLVPLADLLWHYEEIGGTRASDRQPLDDAISARLAAGESLDDGACGTDNFAKLLERLLVFRKLRAPFWPKLMPIAEQLLGELKGRRIALVERARGGPRSLQALAASAVAERPAELACVPAAVVESLPTEPTLSVAVLGDASASMQVCVDASCIAGAMMSAIFEAELVFFNSTAFRARSHAMPTTAEEVLTVTEEVRAGRTTSPAAGLAEFHVAKKPIDIFIVVTDEEENSAWVEGREVHSHGMHGGLSFAELFVRYRAEVHAAARCVFVSFLSKRTAGCGQMVSSLARQGIEAAHVKYDQQRPDLSKFDSLLGSVMLEASKTLHSQALERAASTAADAMADASLAVAVAEAEALEQAARDAAARSVDQMDAGALIDLS